MSENQELSLQAALVEVERWAGLQRAFAKVSDVVKAAALAENVLTEHAAKRDALRAEIAEAERHLAVAQDGRRQAMEEDAAARKAAADARAEAEQTDARAAKTIADAEARARAIEADARKEADRLLEQARAALSAIGRATQ